MTPNASLSNLFQPIKVGNLTLSHRVVLAPLTRFRATNDFVPLVPLVKEYYSQRASMPGSLLITEAAIIHRRAGGYANVPGIWNDAQIEAWKEIVDAIHNKGSYIFLQVVGIGRIADPSVLHSEDGSESYDVVSASALPMAGKPIPRPLSVEEIKQYAEYFATAAKNAVEKAGFDGVEIHGANGYLIEQFLKEASNKRTDSYGGSPENRSKFALEIVDAVVDAVGPTKTGLRLSPWNTDQETGDRDPIPTYSHLVRELKKFHPALAYIHVIDPRIDGGHTDRDEASIGNRSNQFIRDIWTEGNSGRRLISAGGYDLKTGTELADAKGDLVAYGRRFISNPDLPYRLKHDIPLNAYDRSTFYCPGSLDPKGFTDYPSASADLIATAAERASTSL
ncbi:hypothetical protein V5O48_008987 [Marasmius crinis-equi]|uniref:NADH:flavin oxidoreductase/NADH oxidase N-terminal domain-containing protein n=1 Tax=Marasmius crinis-equi TaxID=585013 RepID=A0ABR3FCF7_9AGAR